MTPHGEVINKVIEELMGDATQVELSAFITMGVQGMLLNGKYTKTGTPGLYMIRSKVPVPIDPSNPQRGAREVEMDIWMTTDNMVFIQKPVERHILAADGPLPPTGPIKFQR